MGISRSTYYYQKKENTVKTQQEQYCLSSSLLWLSENNRTTGEGEDQSQSQAGT